MVAALQRRKLNMFELREGMFSPRALNKGNPARAKFTDENSWPVLELVFKFPLYTVNEASIQNSKDD